MKPKRLVLAAIPVLILVVALWFVGKYQPVTVEVEGTGSTSGSTLALRALAQACRDYPLARQITVKRTRDDSLTEREEFVYDRRKHTLSRLLLFCCSFGYYNVKEDDVMALGELKLKSSDYKPANDYGWGISDFLERRGCKNHGNFD